MKKAVLFIFIAITGLIFSGCYAVIFGAAMAKSAIERSSLSGLQGTTDEGWYGLFVSVDTDKSEDREFLDTVKFNEKYIMLIDTDIDSLYICPANPYEGHEKITQEEIEKSYMDLPFFKIDLKYKVRSSSDLGIVGYIDTKSAFMEIYEQVKILDNNVLFIARTDWNGDPCLVGGFIADDDVKARFRSIYNRLEIVD